MPSPSRKVLRFVPESLVSQHFLAISETMDGRLRHWGAHAWRIVGRPPRARLEIVVPETLGRAANPVTPVDIAGVLVKPSVVASHAALRRERRTGAATSRSNGGAVPIAPGVAVRIGRAELQESVGIAAILTDSDGARAILTCGHPGSFSYSGEVLAADQPDGEPIANLSVNLLEGSPAIDAALCPLTEYGEELLDQSKDAPTWDFAEVRQPTLDDNGQSSVFWRPGNTSDSAATSPVTSFSAQTRALFGARGPRNGFIETGHAVYDGNSGLPLTIGHALYGLCSGYVGYNAFFTPLSTILGQLNKKGTTWSIFTPSAS